MSANVIAFMGGPSSEEIRRPPAFTQRTGPPVGGGRRGERHGIRRRGPGGARVGGVAVHHLAGAPGAQDPGTETSGFEGSPSRGRTQSPSSHRPALGGGSEFASGAHHPRGPRVAATMDVQKPAHFGPPVADDGSRHQLPDGGRPAPAGPVQPPGEPEDSGGGAQHPDRNA